MSLWAVAPFSLPSIHHCYLFTQQNSLGSIPIILHMSVGRSQFIDYIAAVCDMKGIAEG